MAISFFAAPILALSVQSSTFNVLHTCAGIGCLCVSPPVSKGSTSSLNFNLFEQGATGSLHSCRQRSSMQMTRMQGLIIPVYLQPKLVTTLSNLLGLFSMVLHDTFPQTISHRRPAAALPLCAFRSQVRKPFC